MKVRGINYLDDNFYDSLIIKEGKTGLDIIAKGPDLNSKTISAIPVLKSLDRLSLEQLKNELIRYFIRYNKINLIEDNYVYHGKIYSKISSNRSNMLLSLNYSDLNRELFNEVIDKYEQDRLCEVYKNNLDIDQYSVITSPTRSQYSIFNDKVNGEIVKKIKLHLRCKDGKILESEKVFLLGVIKDKLSMECEDAVIERSNYYDFDHERVFLGDYILECGSLKVEFKDEDLLSLLSDLVQEHNYNANRQYRIDLKEKVRKNA